jgi:hypothetical protein
MFCEDIELGSHGKNNSHGPFGRAKYGEEKTKQSEEMRQLVTEWTLRQ